MVVYMRIILMSADAIMLEDYNLDSQFCVVTNGPWKIFGVSGHPELTSDCHRFTIPCNVPADLSMIHTTNISGISLSQS